MSIYLDNAATTHVDIEAFNKASQFAVENFYNPSALYRGSLNVKKVLEEGRNILLKQNYNKKFYFTSCGSESDNTAIFSFCGKGNVVTTLGEHSAVYNSFNKLKMKGYDVRFASLKEGGVVDIDDLLSKIDDNTTFVSVVHVNNETGGINDINNIAKLVKNKNPKIIFHSDGVQAFGKLNFSLDRCVDLYSVSAHKIGGLKGTGGLFVNKNLNVQPYIIGGGQESGVRAGTENVLGDLTFAYAYQNRLKNIDETYKKTCELRDEFLDRLDKNIFKVISNKDSSPFVISISAYGLKGAVLQNMMDDLGVIIGTGSACNSRSPHSRVLKSFIDDTKVLDGAIRISFSYDTKIEDIIEAVEKLNLNGKILFDKINR